MSVEDRVRALCLALPGTTEKLSHGAPAFFTTKQYAHLWPHGHHDRQEPHLWCAAPDGAQAARVAGHEQCFVPPYVGKRGWVGIRLDGDVDWGLVEELLEDAHAAVT